MPVGACPECDADVVFAEPPMLNMHIQCENCYSELVVIGLAPIELDWAFAEPFVARPHRKLETPSGGESGTSR